MDLDGDQKVGIFAICCLLIVFVLIISCTTFYHLEYNNMVERMVDKGISPAYLECADRVITHPDNETCRFILTNGDMKPKLLVGENNGQ